ncbi:NAD(P)H-dependent oxidoreductase [Klebsiella quasipneumoniae]|uniref:NAD(P)H-dependent oxidoreductase n=1 Tax=Klebsiella quasipneumoniae TaxID=1463165 RepID=UPI003F482B97
MEPRPAFCVKGLVDHITRAGRTFAFTPEGKKIGLVSGKKVYCVVASGSVFAHGPFVADDQFTPYIRVALEYIGITDVQFIRVDGTHDPSLVLQRYLMHCKPLIVF